MFHVKQGRECFTRNGAGKGGMFHVKQEEGGVSASGGGLPSLPPADLAFSLLFCPHPPCPPSRREGGDQGYFMQGAPPLASPGLNPGGTGSIGGAGAPAPLRLSPGSTGSIGGLAPPAPLRLSSDGTGYFLPRQCFLPPSPRPALAERSSRREGGRPRLFYARGSAPCIPGAEPGRRWLAGGGWRPRHPLRLSPGGTGYFLPCQCFLPPSPLPPFPAGRGRFFVFLCKGLRPLHPRG